jgi:hypothetical protein
MLHNHSAMRLSPDLLVTPSEAVSVLRALEPRAVAALETATMKLTPARLRYLEAYGVPPVVGGSGIKGYARTRLYSVVNIAMLRLWARLSAQGGPALARFALAYVGEDVRAAIDTRRPVVLVVRGRRAELLTARQAAALDPVVSIPVLGLLDGVPEAIAAVRDVQPDIWAGLAWLTPREALQEAQA